MLIVSKSDRTSAIQVIKKDVVPDCQGTAPDKLLPAGPNVPPLIRLFSGTLSW